MSRVNTWLGWFDLCCALGAAALWYLWPQLGAWPLLLGLIPWGARIVRGKAPTHRTPLDVPLFFFLITGMIGVWAAYDRWSAWGEFTSPAGLYKFWLIVGAWLLYYAIANQSEASRLPMMSVLWALFGAAVSLYFLATNDFLSQAVKVEILSRLGIAIQSRLPHLPGHRLQPNVAGGMIAMNVPYAVAWLSSVATQKRNLTPDTTPASSPVIFYLLPIGTIFVMLFGVLMTVSRGAWLALAVALGLWLAWGGGTRLVHILEKRWPRRLWLPAGLLILAGAAAGVAISVLRLGLGKVMGWIPAGNMPMNRLDLLRDACYLWRDYPFTGLGLGRFTMVYSIYFLLIHVGYLTHAHNLFFDIALEQGLPGLAAYLAALATLLVVLWKARHKAVWSIWLQAALASLVVVFVHGLFDDVLYGSRGLLLLFVPFGMLVAGCRDRNVSGAEPKAKKRPAFSTTRYLAGGAVLLVAILIWRRQLASLWLSNLGAVSQTRAELAVYDPDHFDNPTLDEIRRRASLTPAEVHLRQALAWNAGNVTARQRLAAIALSRGAYDEALALLEPIRSGDPVTRLLRGDALVAAGEVERAAEMVRGLLWAESRLEFQAWYRYWLGEDFHRTADAWEAVLNLNPANKTAAYWIAEAKRRAENVQ